MENFVELHRLINIFLRRWWLLVGLTAIALTMGYLTSQRQIPVYEAKATVLVGDITKSTNLNREDVQLSAMFAQTYADLAVRQPVLQGVVEMLDLNGTWEDLRKRVRVTSTDGTPLIEIIAEANSPEMARSIADEVAKQLILIGPASLDNRENIFLQNFIHQQMGDTELRILNGQKRIKEIEAAMNGSISAAKLLELQTEKMNLERLVADLVMNFVELSNLAAQDRNPNTLSIIEPAYADKDPVQPRENLNLLLSGGLGLLLAFGIIFVWENMDDSIKSTDDLLSYGKINVLGIVGKIRGGKYSDKIVTHLDPYSSTAESFRMIRNKIRFGSGSHLAKSIVIISPEPGEGKSITAANLAISMAKANVKTALVDADLIHPVLHQVFKLKNKSGLAELIDSPQTDIEGFLKNTSIDHLNVITSGETEPIQSDRMSTERLSDIMVRLEQMFDVVIIDSPPALLTADPMILSNLADGVIVVVRSGKSKKKSIKQTILDLQEAKANILGCIYIQHQNSNNLPLYKRRRQESNFLHHLKSSITNYTNQRIRKRQVE